MCNRFMSLFRVIEWFSTILFLLCTKIFGILIQFQRWTSQRPTLAFPLHSPHPTRQPLLAQVCIAVGIAILIRKFQLQTHTLFTDDEG